MFLFLKEIFVHADVELFVIEGEHTCIGKDLFHGHFGVLINVGEELEVCILCYVKALGVCHFVNLKNGKCRYTVGDVVASRGNGHTVLPVTVDNVSSAEIGANAGVKEIVLVVGDLAVSHDDVCVETVILVEVACSNTSMVMPAIMM